MVTMKDPKSLALRLIFALGLFDALQMALHHGFTPMNTDWRIVGTTYLVPFGFYWLLFWPFQKFAGEKWACRFAIFLFVARMVKYVIAHIVWDYWGGAYPRFLIGLVVCGLVIFAPWAAWTSFVRRFLPIVTLPAVAVLLLFLTYSERQHLRPGPETKAAEGAPNLVLVSWDTVRADVLPMYGGTMVPMPNLQAWVDKSIQFNDAVAHAPITGPSHASMLTGVVPPEHGLRSNVQEILPPENVVQRLPSLLRDSGYQTGGFIAAYPLRERFGFGEGFAVYDDRMNESVTMRLKDLGYFDSIWVDCFAPFIGKGTQVSTPGEVVQERAFEWLESVPEDDPYFMFLHLYDAHGPWKPVGKYKEIADASFDKALPKSPSDKIEDRKDIARYRGDIALMDDLFADMMVALEKRDPGLQNTIILLTSDHGECFGEGGISKNHVNSLYEATQHVPMFLYLPGAQGAGMQVEETVTHQDILPTLLAAAEVELPEITATDAYPLQKVLMEGGLGFTERPVYMEAQHFNLKPHEKQKGWRTKEWKLIEREVVPDRESLERNYELWKYREEEGVDHKDDQPALLGQMQAALAEYLGGLVIITAVTVDHSAADMQNIDALGYGKSADEDE